MNLFKLLFLVTLFSKSLFCQNSINKDNLLYNLSAQNEDTLKVKSYIKICNSIVFTDPNKSLEFGNKALKLSEKLDWLKGIALAYSVISDAYENQGNNSKALDYRLKELKVWQELDNKMKMCGAYGNIGVSYSNLSNNLKALEYYILSLNLAEKIDHKKIMINSQINIASIYYEQHNFKKALEYYYKALRLAKINSFENSIAEIDCNIGQIFSDQGNFGKALKFQYKALEIFTRLDRKMNMAMILGNIGMVFSLQGDSALSSGNRGLELSKNSKAIEYFRKALKLSAELNNEYLTASLLGNIGSISRKIGKTKESEEYLKRSLEIATRINATDVIQADNTELRLEIEKIKKKLDNHGKNMEIVFQYLDELIQKKPESKPRKRIGYR